MIARTKLYIALSVLDVYQLNRFRKYLLSPYFNQNKDVERLFEILNTSLRNRPNIEDLDRTVVWKQIFGDTPYNDQKFRKLNSDLLKQFARFLAQEVYEKNPLHEANYLLEAVSEKRLEKLFSTSVRTARRLSKNQLHKPASYYFYQYQIERNLYNLTSEFEKRAKKKTDYSVVNIEQIARNLDIFFLAEKLKYYCTVLSWKNVTQTDIHLLFIDEVIRHVQEQGYDDIPAITIHYQIYLTIVEEDDVAHYNKLRKLTTEFGESFPLNELRDIYDSTFNYCIKKVNKGFQHFHREALEVYKEALTRGVLFVNNEMTPISFRNIVVFALRTGEYDWAENFIQDYNIYLNEKYRENAVTFNLARLHLYRKDYQRVIELLREVEYEDIVYNLNSKITLIAAYYESDEFTALESFLDSFRIFLQRNNSIPQDRKKRYRNMVKFTKKLISLPPRARDKIEALKKEIQETEGVVNKTWLLEKVIELERTS